ncbi:5-formyltetrahydrofolate cyclo-ligase [Mycolicibacterium grossiae]|uniref:5-formyltetrahydrofolate cyclo-ligase n=1 Tax=Mycolicibacterium grossiae TaxID=1552759 RepID=A0A1E8QBB7_9MYCO|nr:5-formyltetrahydrofolate cyclo-ligase [Mycolicibacterium grossiae]QEM43442.1 5-formyltetrahydrofolate cyclo-ligase [Mycolicibacterium grossiae]
MVSHVQPGQTAKARLREAILHARRAVDGDRRRAEAAAVATTLRELVAEGATICAYVPVGSEPGSLDALDALVGRGVRVLLPVARETSDGPAPLQWGEYRAGRLVAAPYGLHEPAPPHLPPEAIAEATLVLVPALAVDRQGARLGRGAGFYDRTLPLAAAGARLVAVVRDDEVLDEIPAEPHDVPMTHVVTPGRGLQPLGK